MSEISLYRTTSEIQAFINLLSGKWKLPVIHELVGGPKRFGELRRDLGNISQKVLTDTLRMLEEDGIVERTVYPDTVLHVEYYLSQMGWGIYPILREMTIYMHEYETFRGSGREEEGKNCPYFVKEAIGKKRMSEYSERIKAARKALDESEHLFIGTGSQINTAYGVNLFSRLLAKKIYPDTYKLENIEDLIDRYSNIFPGNEEQFWKFWTAFLWFMRFERNVNEGHQLIAEYAASRDYFAATTNADCQLVRAGLSAERVFAGLGNYTYLQCITPCKNRVFEAEPYLVRLKNLFSKGTFTSSDIPRCPYCGNYLVPNHFRTRVISVASANTVASQEDVIRFVNKTKGSRTVFLEVGCGNRMPNIVRNRIESSVIENPNAVMIRINSDDLSFRFPEAEKQAILFNEGIKTVLPDLLLPEGNY